MPLKYLCHTKFHKVTKVTLGNCAASVNEAKPIFMAVWWHIKKGRSHTTVCSLCFGFPSLLKNWSLGLGDKNEIPPPLKICASYPSNVLFQNNYRNKPRGNWYWYFIKEHATNVHENNAMKTADQRLKRVNGWPRLTLRVGRLNGDECAAT